MGLFLLLDPEIVMDKEEITTPMAGHLLHKCSSVYFTQGIIPGAVENMKMKHIQEVHSLEEDISMHKFFYE